MEVLFKIKKNLESFKNVLLNDDILSRSSFIIRESTALGEKENFYYCFFSGTEEQCKRALELLKDLAEVEKNDEVISKIKEEQDKAAEGFGAIFG